MLTNLALLAGDRGTKLGKTEGASRVKRVKWKEFLERSRTLAAGRASGNARGVGVERLVARVNLRCDGWLLAHSYPLETTVSCSSPRGSDRTLGRCENVGLIRNMWASGTNPEPPMYSRAVFEWSIIQAGGGG